MENTFRVEPTGNGFEPQMRYRAGLSGQDFWMPLLPTGYWAEPDAFATGEVKKRYPLSEHEAASAIERATLLIQDKPLLATVERTPAPIDDRLEKLQARCKKAKEERARFRAFESPTWDDVEYLLSHLAAALHSGEK